MNRIVKLVEKQIKFFVAVVCVLILLCGSVLAAEHDFLSKNDYIELVYDNNNGLGSAAANAVAQTDDGFIWIGTYNGLMRYDGTEFYQFPAKSGITSVSDLFVDSKNNLWIGTNSNGLACYNNGNITFFNKAKGLSSNIVRRIAENDEGTIYVGTTQGLCTIKEGKVNVIDDFRLDHLYVRDLKKANNHKIVGITMQGDIFVVNGNRIESYISKKMITIGQTETVRADNFDSDVYWIGTNGSAILKVRITGNEIKTEEVLLTPGLVNINDIYYHNNNMIVASDSGVGVFDENKGFHILSMKTNNSIDRVMVDYEDNIWFTSSRNGVALLTKTRFRNVFAEAGLEKRVVNSIAEYNDKMYVATDSGLLALQYGQPVADNLTRFLNKTRTRHVVVDSSNNMWIATYANSGLVKYTADGKMKIIDERKGLPNNRVRVVLPTKDETVYVGTRSGMAIIRNDQVVQRITSSSGLPNPQVLCLLEHDGKIYAGTDGGGICVIENDKIVKIIGENDGLKNGVILRMTKDIDSKRIWISTSSGIYYWEDDKLHEITNFPSTNNFDFIFTPYGEMLIASNNGIYITTSKKFRETNGGYVQFLSKRDGLTDSITANSFNFIDSDDNLYMCLQSGITSLNVRHLTDVDNNLKLTVPSINVDGKDIFFDKSDNLSIPSDIRRLTFKGYILSNSLNNAMIYSWLEGFDKEPETYSRFNNKEKTYTNLPGGQYKLHVGIYDTKSDKLVKGKTYTIIKDKKFTEEPLFWVLGVLVLIGFAFFPYRWYMNKRVEKMAVKQKETQEFLDQVINSFATAIDIKDHYTQGHSRRVAEYSRQIAIAMGWSAEDADNLHRIGMLHDVGKVIIPSEVLNKKGPLTDEEYATMKQHTDIGAEILSKITAFPKIALGANTHHERYDGRGYGHKLKGTDIPIEGRIIAVADCFDAMNSSRIYRPSMTSDKILEQLRLARNTQLDGEIVDVLLKLIEKGEIVFQNDAAVNKK